MRPHVVRAREHGYSLALQRGLPPDELWNHPDNRHLREQGRSLGMLRTGDVVYLPETKETPEIHAHSSNSYVSKVERISTRFRLMKEADMPWANVRVLVWIDGAASETTSDGDGWITLPIPAMATRVEIEVDPPALRYTLVVGALEPSDCEDGVRMRLQLLGRLSGSVTGAHDRELREAIESFERDFGLEITGSVSSALSQKLKEIAGV